MSEPVPADNCVLLIEDLAQQHLPARSLAAMLRRAGWDARVAHYGPVPAGVGADNATAVMALAGQLQPRLIVASILFADRVPQYLALMADLRQVSPQSHLAMAGPLPSFVPAEMLAACPALDSVLCGEAELTVVRLAQRVASPARLGGPAAPGAPDGLCDVPGLAYRSRGGCQIQYAPWPRPVADLDSLPSPLRDSIPVTCDGYGFATVQASRGCYHACTFCLPCAFHRAHGGPAYRLRSIPHLVDELEELYRTGTRLFLFDDEQFLSPGNARHDRVERLGNELARRRLKIAFTIKCRPDDVEAELFHRLREMGLLRVYVGIESGCQITLDLLGKGLTAAGSLRALATLAAQGIVADFTGLLFHPWSTVETVGAEIAFLERVVGRLSTLFRFDEVAIFPGTALAGRLRAEGRGDGAPWPLAYTVTDRRAELLRRLSRLLFGGDTAYARMREGVTEAWYTLLLRGRFCPGQPVAERMAQLADFVAGLNCDTLAVWREMVAFAGHAEFGDAGPVNTRAGDWAGRLGQGLLAAEDLLPRLLAS